MELENSLEEEGAVLSGAEIFGRESREGLTVDAAFEWEEVEGLTLRISGKSFSGGG